jgi:hypothetical protein
VLRYVMLCLRDLNWREVWWAVVSASIGMYWPGML